MRQDFINGCSPDRRAERRDNFASGIVAQSIVDLETNAIRHWELLSRPNDVPSNSVEAFFTDMERDARIVDHDLNLIRRAHDVVTHLFETTDSSSVPYLAVNVSPKTLSTVKFFDALKSITKECEKTMPLVMIEITERYDFDDIDQARDNLAFAHSVGMKIIQDDMPHGVCAGVKHKETRPFVSMFKFESDPSEAPEQYLIDDEVIDPDPADRILERIETAEQAASARTHGYGKAQGWHWGKPVPLSDIMAQHLSTAKSASYIIKSL